MYESIDAKFSNLLVSPVYLRASRSLRQPHPAQKVPVAGVGANGVPVGFGFDEKNLRMRLGRLIQPYEGLILAGESLLKPHGNR